MTDVIVAPAVRDLDALAVQLAGWLQDRLDGAGDVSIHNLAYPSGAGQSHETILFDARWSVGGNRREQGFVVRIKPTRHTVFLEDLFDEQYRLMRALYDHGAVRVARPYWLEPDPALLGAPFFVMERKRGRVPVSHPPYREAGWVAEATPAQRRRLWENGVRQLAAIQSVPTASVPFLRSSEGPAEGFEQEWAKYERFVDMLTRDRPDGALRAGFERLRSLRPDHRPPGIVWGDARLGNMMFDDDFEVVAVMDWEQPSLGGALHDLAWWLTLSNNMHGASADRPHLEGMGTREDTLALWRDLTGIPTDDIGWYEDFTQLKLSCAGMRIYQLRGQAYQDEAWLAKRLKVA